VWGSYLSYFWPGSFGLFRSQSYFQDVRNAIFKTWMSFCINLSFIVAASEGIEHQEDETMRHLKKFQFDDIFNSSFAVKRTNLVWVENGKIECI
jgi:hypothetical protein